MYMGKIGQKSAAFINHKPFHPGSYRNLEKVWIAEQKHQEQLRKQNELLDQRQQEGKVEELRRALRLGDRSASGFMPTSIGTSSNVEWVCPEVNSAGEMPAYIAREISDNKLDWMYHQNTIAQQVAEQEKYLTGEKSAMNHPDHTTKGPKHNLAAGSLLLGKGGPASNEDLLRKMREDPCFVIKQAEAQHKKLLQNNPLLRAKMLEEEELEDSERQRRKEIRSLEREIERNKRHEEKLKARKRRRATKERSPETASKKRHRRNSADESRRRKDISSEEDLSHKQNHEEISRNESQQRAGISYKAATPFAEVDDDAPAPGPKTDGIESSFPKYRSMHIERRSRSPSPVTMPASQVVVKAPRPRQGPTNDDLGPPKEMVDSLEAKRKARLEENGNGSLSTFSSKPSDSQVYETRAYNAKSAEFGGSKKVTIEEMRMSAKRHEEIKRGRAARLDQLDKTISRVEGAARANSNSGPAFIHNTRKEMLSEIDRGKSLRQRNLDATLFD